MQFSCDVKIVDMVMGSGKSSAAINYMNSATDEKFLYITPLSSEVERVIKKCNNKRFYTPDEEKFGTKLKSIKHLLSKGYNIASTHALFHYFDREVIDICRNQNYTLVMDEVTDVVEPYELTKADYDTLMEKYLTVDTETGLLRWREDAANYHGKFDQEKTLCEMGCLGYYGGSIVVWLFPIDVFNIFKNIYILTYMFSAQIQRYYYDFFKLPYTYLYVIGDNPNNYQFTDCYTTTKAKHDYHKLIHIIDNDKLNAIGCLPTDLSKAWYQRNAQNVVMVKLKNNLFNFFHNICNTKSSYNLWTTFKDYKYLLSGKGYANGYEASNCRATNKHIARTSVAYVINKYLNTIVKNFFLDNGVEVDEDGYALSEMLQFIWRSAIREGKEINIYIPSRRMRELLQKWIDENSCDEGEMKI